MYVGIPQSDKFSRPNTKSDAVALKFSLSKSSRSFVAARLNPFVAGKLVNVALKQSLISDKRFAKYGRQCGKMMPG